MYVCTCMYVYTCTFVLARVDSSTGLVAGGWGSATGDGRVDDFSPTVTHQFIITYFDTRRQTDRHTKKKITRTQL